MFPIVDPIQHQRESVIKLRNEMERYITNDSGNKISHGGKSLPDVIPFYSNLSSKGAKNQKEEKSKIGAFVTPKTYNIIDSHYASIEKIMLEGPKDQKKGSNSVNCRQICALEAYKHLISRKKD